MGGARLAVVVVLALCWVRGGGSHHQGGFAMKLPKVCCVCVGGGGGQACRPRPGPQHKVQLSS
jgi:hypothetical protein